MKAGDDARATYVTGKYPQHKRVFYKTASGLPDDRVAKLAIQPDGTVWAGTGAGVARLRAQHCRWETFADAEAPPAQQTRMLYADLGGNVWVTVEDRLYRYDGTGWASGGLSAVIAMAEDETGKLYAATATELHVQTAEGWEELRFYRGIQVRGMAAFGNRRIYLATNRGLYGLLGKRPRWFEVDQEHSGLVSNDVRCIFADEYGHVWAGTDKGISIYDDKSFFYTLTSGKGLPCEDITAIAAGPEGERWFGTRIGAARLKDGKWKLFASERWIPDNRVLCLACAADGSAWIGTESGIAQISVRMMTLLEKAEYYDELVEPCHLRWNFIAACAVDAEGRRIPGGQSYNENDGLWTSDYVASQSYRYAVTGDEQARRRAKNSVNAMLDLVEITGRSGFVARTKVHRSEPQFNEVDSPHEWHLSADGEWLWKGETSSDEASGHFYAYSVFYDLAADEEDKERIRKAVRAIADHWLANDFCFTDVDGLPTTWGVWSPDKLNNDVKLWEQRGINSLQMLSFMKTAAHITGDDKYGEAYRRLVSGSHFAMNTLEQKVTFLGKASSIDDNLAFHAYMTLLKYEDDPHLRSFYMMSLEHHWQFERPERVPFFNFVYGVHTGRACDVEAAADSLAEIPLDLISWHVDNSDRTDVKFDPDYSAYGYRILDRALPYDERPMLRWNKSAYHHEGGGHATALEPSIFLHPYWMGRYWKLIEERGL